MGKAAWAPRRIGHEDLVRWLEEFGIVSGTVDPLPSPRARLGANTRSGHGEPHDRHGRTLQAMSVTSSATSSGAGEEGARVRARPSIAFAPDMIPLDRFGAVIFAGGHRPDYQSGVLWPDALDDVGFPIQTDGASSVVDSLYFIGVPFVGHRKSSLLLRAGGDAAVVADTIAARVAVG